MDNVVKEIVTKNSLRLSELQSNRRVSSHCTLNNRNSDSLNRNRTALWHLDMSTLNTGNSDSLNTNGTALWYLAMSTLNTGHSDSLNTTRTGERQSIPVSLPHNNAVGDTASHVDYLEVLYNVTDAVLVTCAAIVIIASIIALCLFGYGLYNSKF